VHGREEHARAFLPYLAATEPDPERVVALRERHAANCRVTASSALSTDPTLRTDSERSVVRPLAVALTNLGMAQTAGRNADGVGSLDVARRLAHELGDWRLEASNRMNLGVHLMEVPSPPDVNGAEAEFQQGYDIAIAQDPQLAGRLMTERGTVFFERGMATHGADARAYFERAAERLELALRLMEPNAVLLHQLGQVHRRLGNFAASREWFELAIELRDTQDAPGASADTRLHLAESLEDAGLLGEALTFARSADTALADAHSPAADLQLEIERTIARLSVLVYTR
jgi:tetratricopeptide (TPR) repeat protein